VESDLRAYLIAQADIAAVTTRVYLLNAPQGAARPLIVFSINRGESLHHLAGYSGLTLDALEIDCQDVVDVTSKSLKELVRKKLDGYRGSMGSSFVSQCILRSETDEYTPPQNASDRGTYHSLMSFDVWHSEPSPTV
jgi:hypothetical protein